MRHTPIVKVLVAVHFVGSAAIGVLAVVRVSSWVTWGAAVWLLLFGLFLLLYALPTAKGFDRLSDRHGQ